MKFKIKRRDLLAALSLARRSSDPKSTMPMLAYVRLSAQDGVRPSKRDGLLEVAATDLDTTVVSTHTCEVVDPGEVALPTKWLYDMVSSVTADTVTISTEFDAHARVHFVAGKTKCVVNGLPTRDFPKIGTWPEKTKTKTKKVSASVIADGVRKVAYAASRDLARLYLCGVRVDADSNGTAICVSTDGTRLVRVRLGVLSSDLFCATIPRRAIKLLLDFLADRDDVEVAMSYHVVHVRDGDVRVAIKSFGDYAPFASLFDQQQPNRFVVDRAALAAALVRGEVARNADVGCLFQVADGVLRLSSSTADAAWSESLDVERVDDSSAACRVSMNTHFLRDALANMSADKVLLGIGHELDPVRLEAYPSSDPCAILMPMRPAS